MLHQGQLIQWDATQGLGLIHQHKSGSDFVVRSADFRKLPEHLKSGDTIYFQISFDSEGKTKVEHAYKAGQIFAPAALVKKPISTSLPVQTLLSTLSAISVVAWLGYQSIAWFSNPVPDRAQAAPLYPKQQQLRAELLADNPVWPPVSQSQFHCEGKQHCSQMTSCDEAEYYLAHCPDVKIDGDHDGVPCEQQWCPD